MAVHVSNRVVVRNKMGQFIRECEDAAQRTVVEAINEGADLSAALAPKRTGALAASIVPLVLSRTSGVWGSSLKYAMPQEEGSVRHALPADVSFWWEREARMWMPPDVYLRVTGYPGNDPIDHPGNPATHYLRDAYRVISRRLVKIAAKHYPG